jgi:hypothetical protein
MFQPLPIGSDSTIGDEPLPSNIIGSCCCFLADTSHHLLMWSRVIPGRTPGSTTRDSRVIAGHSLILIHRLVSTPLVWRQRAAALHHALAPALRHRRGTFASCGSW